MVPMAVSPSMLAFSRLMSESAASLNVISSKFAHEAGIHLPRAAALLAVKNIGLGRAAVALLHQHLLHKVLHMLDLRLAALELEHGLHLAG